VGTEKFVAWPVVSFARKYAAVPAVSVCRTGWR